MSKIACVFSFKQSSWVSCQKIVRNLHKSYELLQDTDLVNFNLDEEMDQVELLELARKIANSGCEIISFMDHKPHPLPLIQQLLKLLDRDLQVKFVFHVFGDFTLYYTQWDALGELLAKRPCKFFVASPRQKALIDRLLREQETVVCPFPFDETEFHLGPQRESWGVEEQDRIFVFTGRLSRQKRIKTLLSVFARAFPEDPHAKLFFYGAPDHIGEPFFGQYQIEGEYFRRFYSFYKTLPEEVQARIRFMGAVPNSELLSVYLGADALVNLSVHNDEDYGMSVAEAQACGLPSVLTDWGGLAGFAHDELPDAVRLIPVWLGDRGKEFDRTFVIKTLQETTMVSWEKRRRIAQKATDVFSVDAVGKILQRELSVPFKTFAGFGPLFRKAVNAHQYLPFRPLYLTPKQTLSPLYRELYSAYVR
jgi:glycosyltransferase involved in cell wall biosynthesis